MSLNHLQVLVSAISSGRSRAMSLKPLELSDLNNTSELCELRWEILR